MLCDVLSRDLGHRPCKPDGVSLVAGHSEPLAFLAMDGWTIAADIAVMVTGLSAVTAASTWLAGRWRNWRQERAQAKLRNWHAYVAPERINEWYVRLADDPKTPTGTVTLEVLSSRDGEPDAGLAYSMRTIIGREGMLSRAPTPEEYDFLKAQRKTRHETGFPVGSDQLVSGSSPFTRSSG